MKGALLILFGLILLVATGRRRRGAGKSKWFNQLTGLQKIFGILAFALVILILLNPEFLALGFLGDTAFIDMLVLALSLQMHTGILRAARTTVSLLKKTLRTAGIPSPGFCYLIAVLTVIFGDAASALQKFFHRLLS